MIHLKAYTTHCPKINYENAMFMQWCDARITILLVCENSLVSDSCLGVSIENLPRFSHCMNAILIIFIHFYAMSSCVFFLIFTLFMYTEQNTSTNDNITIEKQFLKKSTKKIIWLITQKKRVH